MVTPVKYERDFKKGTYHLVIPEILAHWKINERNVSNPQPRLFPCLYAPFVRLYVSLIRQGAGVFFPPPPYLHAQPIQAYCLQYQCVKTRKFATGIKLAFHSYFFLEVIIKISSLVYFPWWNEWTYRPGGHQLNYYTGTLFSCWSHCNTLEDLVPGYKIYRHPICKWISVNWVVRIVFPVMVAVLTRTLRINENVVILTKFSLLLCGLGLGFYS